MTTPKHLSPSGKKLYREIFEEVDVADRAAELLLATLCEQFDRMRAAQALIARDGLVLKDRFGQAKANPACAIEVAAAAGVMRAWRLLGFDTVPPGTPGRPAGR